MNAEFGIKFHIIKFKIMIFFEELLIKIQFIKRNMKLMINKYCQIVKNAINLWLTVYFYLVNAGFVV